MLPRWAVYCRSSVFSSCLMVAMLIKSDIGISKAERGCVRVIWTGNGGILCRTT